MNAHYPHEELSHEDEATRLNGWALVVVWLVLAGVVLATWAVLYGIGWFLLNASMTTQVSVWMAILLVGVSWLIGDRLAGLERPLRNRRRSRRDR